MTKKPVANDTLLAQLNWRYATKKFNPVAKIPASDWSTLEQVLILSPSSFGLQPWKFLVITDPAIKAALGPVSWGQTQPADCSHFVVFAVKKNLGPDHVEKFLDRQIEVRGGKREALAQYRDMILGSLHSASAAGTLDAWQTHQVYIALGQFMASAAMLGIDTCPMEGIDRARYDEILKLKDTAFTTVVGCAAGYRATDDNYAAAPKVRFRPEEIITRF
jgi:nitroreductase